MKELKWSGKINLLDKPELAIIDKEIFYRAQQLLTERKENFNLTQERQSNKYCFSTMIKCEDCVIFSRIQRRYVNNYIRWCCAGRNANGIDFCANHTIIDEQELLDEIKIYLSKLDCPKR